MRVLVREAVKAGRYGLPGQERRTPNPARGGCEPSQSEGSSGTTVHHAICRSEIQEKRREMLDSLTASAGRTLRRADRLARRRGAATVDPLDLLASLTTESESRAAL